MLMYDVLLIGFYMYCLGVTVELGCDSIFIRMVDVEQWLDQVSRCFNSIKCNKTVQFV